MLKITSITSLRAWCRAHQSMTDDVLVTKRGATQSHDTTTTTSPRASGRQTEPLQRRTHRKLTNRALLGVLLTTVIMVMALPPSYSVEFVVASPLSSIDDQRIAPSTPLTPTSQSKPSNQSTKSVSRSRVYRHWVLNPERLGAVDPDWEASFRAEAQRALANGRWANALSQQAQALQAYANSPHGRTRPMSLKTFTWREKTPLLKALEKLKGRRSAETDETLLAPFSPAVTAALDQLKRTYLFFDAESVPQRAFVRAAVMDASRRAQPLTLLAINGTMRAAQRVLDSTVTPMTEKPVSAHSGLNAEHQDRQQEPSDLTAVPSAPIHSAMPTTVFFDQYGALSQKLGVTHLPALVRLSAKTIEGLTPALTPDGEPMDPEALSAFWNDQTEYSK